VTVATTVEEAQAAIEAIFQGQFAKAGKFVLVEECLTGQEASVLALTDGLTIRPATRSGSQAGGGRAGGMGLAAL